MPDGVNYYLLLSVPGTVVPLLIFLYVSFRHRQAIDHLKQRVHDSNRERVEHYLQREIQVTRQRSHIAEKDKTGSTDSLDTVRLIWLEAELAALVDQGRHRSNPEALRRVTQPLLRMLKQPARAADSKSESAKNTPAVRQILKARDTLDLQANTLARLRQSVSTPAEGVGTAQQLMATTTLGRVEQNTAELKATIARLESELFSLHDKFEITEIKLQEARRQSLPLSSQHSSPASSTAVPPESKLDTTRALLEETTQAYQQAVAEMNRMREINRQQRTLILRLEKEMGLLQKDSSQHEASTAILDQFKLQLRDYEMCTAILESETDSLRDKITELTQHLAHETDGAQPAKPADGVSSLSVEDRAHAGSQVNFTALIEEFVGKTEPERILATVIEWLKQKKLSTVIFLNGRSEQRWASTEGSIDSHSKQLLQSIGLTPDNPLVEISVGLLFVYSNCRVLIYQSADLGTYVKELLRLFPIVDGWLSLLEAQQLMQQESHSLDQLHVDLNALLGQYHYVVAEHRRMTEKLHSEFQDFLASADLSEIQQQCAASMLEDYQSEQSTLGKASRLVYDRLKMVVQNIDERLSI